MLKMLKDLIDAQVGGVDVVIKFDETRFTLGKAIDADQTGIAVVDGKGAHFLTWAAIESINVSLNDLTDRGMVPNNG